MDDTSSNNQQILTPQEQDSLFQLLQKAGALSKDVGQSPNTPDTQAQSGTGGVDFNTLQSLLKHASNPSAVPMQEGDKMHPMDAISQIGQQLQQGQQNQPQQSSQPQQPDNRIPININQQRQGLFPELLRLKTPGMSIQQSAPGFVGALGMKENVPVGPNYAQAVPPELQKFLPSPTYKMPDGSNYVSKDDIDQARMMAMSQSLIQNRNAAHPILPDDFGSKVLAGDYNGALQTLKDNKIPLTSQIEGLLTNAKRGDTLSAALLGRVANQQTSQGADLGNLLSAAKTQGDFKTQNDKVTNSIHATQLLNQYYDPKTGDFNIPKTQYNEFAQTAAKVLTNNPILSNEQIDQINQRTAKGDFSGLANYFGMTDQNGQQFTGSTQSVINNLADTVIRQGITAQALRDQYIQSGAGAYAGLKQTNPALYNAVIQNTFGTAPDLATQVKKSAYGHKYADLTGGAAVIPPNPNRVPPLGNPPAQQGQPMTGTSKSGRPIISTDGGKTWSYK